MYTRNTTQRWYPEPFCDHKWKAATKVEKLGAVHRCEKCSECNLFRELDELHFAPHRDDSTITGASL